MKLGGVYHVLLGPCAISLTSLWTGLTSAILGNIYILSAVPLANVTPDFSHFGSTIPRGVTAAIGTAFC